MTIWIVNITPYLPLCLIKKIYSGTQEHILSALANHSLLKLLSHYFLSLPLRTFSVEGGLLWWTCVWQTCIGWQTSQLDVYCTSHHSVCVSCGILECKAMFQFVGLTRGHLRGNAVLFTACIQYVGTALVLTCTDFFSFFFHIMLSLGG